jgi:hypothetical protein
MRLYRYVVPDNPVVEPFILAETTEEGPDATSPWVPIPPGFVSKAELLSTPEGTRALERWRAEDDSQEEEDARLLLIQCDYEELARMAENGRADAIFLLATDPEPEEVRRFIREDAERSYRENHSDGD